MLAELDELVGLAVGHGGVGDALEGLRAVAHLPVELVGAAREVGGPLVLHREIEPVQVLPHLAADLVAHAARVLAGAGDAGRDGIRVDRVPDEELDTRCSSSACSKCSWNSASSPVQGDERLPAALGVLVGRVEEGVEVHGQGAGHVFGALDVARHPVERLGHAREHAA